jgi:hypothetical protein
MNRLKAYLQDFPTHGATVAVALVLTLSTGIIIEVRLALGWPFPDYSDWLLFLAGLCGTTTIGMIGKRATTKDAP